MDDEVLAGELVSRSWAEQEAIIAADAAVRADPSVLRVLDRLAHERAGFLPLTALPPLAELPPAATALLELNAKNTAWLKSIVTDTGWPGRSRVGEDGADCAWMIAQHADRDRDFQEQCRQLLLDAVRKREADPRHYAMLVDRLCRADSRSQVYGTYCTIQDGALAFVIDVNEPAELDERRRALGLPDVATDEAGMLAGDSLTPYPPSRKHPANQWPPAGGPG